MFNFQKLRMPYREDSVFSTLVLTVLLIPLAFTFFTYENYETMKFALWAILAGSALLVFLFSGQYRNHLKLPKVFSWAVLGFLICAILSTVFSFDIIHSVFGFYYRFTSGLIFYLCFFAVIFLLTCVLTEDKFKFLVKILIFDAFLVALVGLLQSLGIGYYESLDQGGFLRAPSLLGNPNFSSMFIVTVLPWAVAAAVKSPKIFSKLYYSLACLFIILCLIALGSRGALLALLSSLGLIIAIFSLRKSWKVIFKFIVPCILALVVVFLLLSAVRPDNALRLNNFKSDKNVTLRLDVWQATALGIFHHPWLGVGPGNFNIFFEQIHGKDLAGLVGQFDDAHNLFLHLAATGGLPFLGFFLLILGWTFYKCLPKKGAVWQEHQITSASALIAFCVAASFTPVSLGNFLVLTVILAGVAFRHKEISVRWPLGAGPKILMAIISIFFIVIGLSLLSSEYIFASAYRNYYSGNFQRSYKLVKLAIAINPTNPTFYIFRAADEIQTNQAESLIVKHIEQIKQQHPLESGRYIVAAKLYYLYYFNSKNIKYLPLAIANIKQSLNMDAYFGERYGLAAAYEFVLGKMDDAERDVNTSLSLNPDFFPSWMLKAKISQLKGQRQQTIFSLEKAFKIFAINEAGAIRPQVQKLETILSAAKTWPDIKQVPIEVQLDENNFD